MAYGTKYTNTFSVKEGPTKVYTEYILYIKRQGYAGVITNLPDLGSGGIVAKINNQDSYKGIQEKTLSIDILTNINLSELLDAQPKEWKVELSKLIPVDEGTDWDERQDFVGYLQASKNSTPYEDGRINYRLEACDGLKFLKNIDFVDDSNIYFEGSVSVFEAARLCLAKAELGLNINTINNIRNADDDNSDAINPLTQRCIDLDLYRGENEPLDTYKVLGSILESEGMRIFQEGAEWWIEYVPEKSTGQVISRKHSASGTQQSFGNLDLRVSAVHNSDYYQPLGGGTLTNLSPIKFAKITHKLADWKNQLANKDFRLWNGTSFTNWVNHGADLSRTGNGTVDNPYGPSIGGYVSKAKNANYIEQTVLLATEANARNVLQYNLTFKGQAFTKNVERAAVGVSVNFVIKDYEFNSIVYPRSYHTKHLDENSEWTYAPSLPIAHELNNKDVNNHAKKTPVDFSLTSKKLDEITLLSADGTAMPNWRANIESIEVIVRLIQGIGQLTPYPGDSSDSAVWYKNISLGWIAGNTNLNLKEVYYKASQTAYSPNDELIDAAYGDYADIGNLSALKTATGQATKTWKGPTDMTGRNFHSIHAADVLVMQNKTQKVYDGTIWGLLKYRHSVQLAGFANRGYIVGYTYNYCTSMCEVRIVEHQTPPATITRKKVGGLSDGTEITLVDENVPAPKKGIGGLIDYLVNLAKSIKNGMAVTNDDDETALLIWDKIEDGQVHDMSTIVRQNNNLRIGKDDEILEVGKSTGLVKMLGGLSLGNLGGFFTSFVTTATTARQVTMPDRDIVVNDWDYLDNKPTMYFEQNIPEANWAIVHNFGRKALCQTFNMAGEQVFGDIQQVSNIELHVKFSKNETGYALLMGI